VTTKYASAQTDHWIGQLLRLETGFTAAAEDDTATVARIEREAGAAGRTDLVLRARLCKAVFMLQEGDNAGGGRLAHEVYTDSVELGDDYVQARCHRALSLFFHQLGDSATALAHAVQCMSHTTDDMPLAIRTRHLMVLAVLLDETGSADEGMRTFTEALAVAKASGDGDLTLRLLNNMAYTAYERGDVEAAEDLAQRMRAVSAEAGVPLSATLLDTLARVSMLSGRPADVAVILSPLLGEEVPKEILDEGNALEEALLTAAEACRELGDTAQAQTLLDRIRRRCAERGLAGLWARAREQQSLVHAAAGRYREAFEEYREFHAESRALTTAEQDARSRALQAVYQADEARRATEQFRELALRDALTGLHNRRYVDDALPAALAAASGAGGQVSVAMIDLDHFKRINDTLSHEIGDRVLRRFATLVDELLPRDAVIARLGGEEFLLLLPGADETAGWLTAERIRHAVTDHDWSAITGDLPVTCSIGVTTVSVPGPTASAVLAAADRNLYAAKRSGRNRVCGDPVTSS
jgi:diguanylate cyclase (GGDEF)-like protein